MAIDYLWAAFRNAAKAPCIGLSIAAFLKMRLIGPLFFLAKYNSCPNNLEFYKHSTIAKTQQVPNQLLANKTKQVQQLHFLQM